MPLRINASLLAASNCYKVVEEGQSIPRKALQKLKQSLCILFFLITGSLRGVLPALTDLMEGDREKTGAARP